MLATVRFLVEVCHDGRCVVLASVCCYPGYALTYVLQCSMLVAERLFLVYRLKCGALVTVLSAIRAVHQTGCIGS
jgi:hypothetical protein